MVADESLWPADAEPKTLLCLRVRCRADDLFKTLWVNPDLQEKLHKLRNDSNLVETAWTASRQQLPREQYTWQPAAPAGAGKSIIASNRWRKVRFDSPPAALASKPFQNEEIQHCTDYIPGRRYIVETQANTSAPMGDKFNLFFKTVILAESKTSCFLHTFFAIKWDASISFILKGPIGKAVDGGVRGTYKTYRQVLESMHPTLQDVDTSQVKEMEGGVEEEEGHAPAPPAPSSSRVEHAAPAAAPQPAAVSAAPAGPMDPLSYLYNQLVWQEQLAGVSDVVGVGLRPASTREGKVARILAAGITLAVIHSFVALLQRVQAFCADQRHIIWLLCLPINKVIDVPDSLAEVLTSILLVALVNAGIIWAAHAAMGSSGSSLPRVAYTAAPAAAASAPHGGAAATTTAAAGDTVSAAAASGASNAGGGGSSTSTLGGDAAAGAAGASNGAAAPAAAAKAAAPAATTSRRPEITPPKGRASDPVVSSNHPAHAALHGGAAQLLSSHTSSPGGTTRSATPPGRLSNRTTTATTTQPPQQMEMTSLAASSSRQSSSTGAAAGGSSKTASGVGSGAPMLPASMPHARSTSGAATTHPAHLPISASSPALAAAVAGGAATPSSTTAPGARPSTPAVSGAAATGEVASPGSVHMSRSPTTLNGGGEDEDGAAGGHHHHDEDGTKGSAHDGLLALVPPQYSSSPTGSMLASPMPAGAQGSGAGGSGNGSSSSMMGPAGAAGMAGGGGPGGGPEPMKAWIKSVSQSFDAMAENFKGAFGMKPGMGILNEDGTEYFPPVPEGMLGPDSPFTASGQQARTSAPQVGAVQSPASSSGGLPLSSMLAVGQQPSMRRQADSMSGGANDPDVVVEEVFENERFQPFRQWGHSWPGHFLPSDRVGHWSDALGGPGGTVSMEFENVEPRLPPGFKWLEKEWQLDMSGLDTEACDENGWTYALDFNYLRHPAPPGTGKCNMKHFVRRRRWMRTRVRIVPVGDMMGGWDEADAASLASPASTAGMSRASGAGLATPSPSKGAAGSVSRTSRPPPRADHGSPMLNGSGASDSNGAHRAAGSTAAVPIHGVPETVASDVSRQVAAMAALLAPGGVEIAAGEVGAPPTTLRPTQTQPPTTHSALHKEGGPGSGGGSISASSSRTGSGHSTAPAPPPAPASPAAPFVGAKLRIGHTATGGLTAILLPVESDTPPANQPATPAAASPAPAAPAAITSASSVPCSAQDSASAAVAAAQPAAAPLAPPPVVSPAPLPAATNTAALPPRLSWSSQQQQQLAAGSALGTGAAATSGGGSSRASIDNGNLYSSTYPATTTGGGGGGMSPPMPQSAHRTPATSQSGHEPQVQSPISASAFAAQYAQDDLIDMSNQPSSLPSAPRTQPTTNAGSGGTNTEQVLPPQPAARHVRARTASQDPLDAALQ